MRISICVRKHSVCELYLKVYIYECSTALMRFCVGFDTSHHGPPDASEDVRVVKDSVTGIHNAWMKCLFVVIRS
jgi:hypothetical protein